jgi:rRNA maturation protein Nop10
MNAQNTHPGHFTSGTTHRYPLHGTLSRCGWLRKISSPPGFEPQNVQPVASRYTDWANPVCVCVCVCVYIYIYIYIYDRYDIFVNCQEVGCGYMDRIGLVQDRYRWRTLVSAVMNLRVPWNAGNFLTSCKPVSFSRRTLHRGVSKYIC